MPEYLPPMSQPGQKGRARSTKTAARVIPRLYKEDHPYFALHGKACIGCGRVGVDLPHYADCTLLEPTDLVLDRAGPPGQAPRLLTKAELLTLDPANTGDVEQRLALIAVQERRGVRILRRG